MSTITKTIAVVGILTLSTLATNYPRSIQASPANSLHLSQERVYKLLKESVPDVVEIVEVKNLNAADFPKSMEVIVKNLSNKNIYGISMVMRFTDSNMGGALVGSALYYGDKRLNNYENRANPDEDFIPPGKTGIVKLEPDRADSMVIAIERDKLPLSWTYNVQIELQTLNFGDGTGYLNREPLPQKRSN